MKFNCGIVLLIFLTAAIHGAEPVPLGTEGTLVLTCTDKPVDIIYNEEYPPLQMRIIARKPLAGGQQELTLAWVSNRVGTYKVSDYLYYVDGSVMDIDDTVESIAAFGILPEDHDGSIHAGTAVYDKPALLYADWLKIIGALWIAGLITIIVMTRRRKKHQTTVVPVVSISLAEHLRQLLNAAADKPLSESEQATIERLIYTYWQRKLGLSEKSVQDAIPQMRADREAGSALQELDKLFHRPGPRPDLEQVLAPYKQCSLAELEL